jgi:general stress protein 26
MNTTEKQKFRALLGAFDTGMLITHDGEGGLRARPMAFAAVDENCDLWFLTARDSAKVHEIARDTRVHVVCQSGWSSCLSLSGHASIDEDTVKIHALWKPAFRIWFPGGVNDPDIALIHVVGEEGEFWDNSGTQRFTYLYQRMKAIMTGSRPEVKEGEQHGRVNFVNS